MFWESPDQLQTSARVVALSLAGAIDWLQFDRTCFHPNGGGQPSDQGYVEGAAFRFRVHRAVSVDGAVLHAGTVLAGEPQVETVDLVVDPAPRAVHSRLHTAGHTVIAAMRELFGMVPTYEHHYPGNAYVEFRGQWADCHHAGLMQAVQARVDSLVEADTAVSTRCVAVDERRESIIRVVGVGPTEWACGGTHVKRTGELSGLTVVEFASSRSRTRVGYGFGEPT